MPETKVFAKTQQHNYYSYLQYQALDPSNKYSSTYFKSCALLRVNVFTH